jgi:DNA-binding NtrC family response regulator
LIESGGAEIKADHLHLLHRPPPAGRRAVRGAKVEFASSLPLNLAEAEDLLIHRAIQETGGNIADAARMLGIHRTRIYRRLSQGESMAGDANGGQSVSTVPTATIATPETRHASQL